MIELFHSLAFIATLLFVVAAGYAGFRTGHYLIPVLVSAFLLRVGVILSNSRIGILPAPPIADGHHTRASIVSRSLGDISVASDGMRILVAHLIAPFHLLYGSEYFITQIAIAAYSIVIGYLVYRIGLLISSYRAAVIAATLTLLWPSILYRSVVIQREVLVTILMLAVVLICIRLSRGFRLQDGVALMAVSALMFFFRAENIMIIVFVAVVAVLLNQESTQRRIALLAGAAIPAFLFFALNMGQLAGFGSKATPEMLNEFAHGRDHGNTAYLVSLHYETWFDVFISAPIKIIFFLASPMPWQINGVTTLFASISGFAAIIAILQSRRGIAILWGRNDLVILLSYLCLGVVSYSIIEMNGGAAFRRRIQFIPIILLFVAVGYQNVRVKLGTGQS